MHLCIGLDTPPTPSFTEYAGFVLEQALLSLQTMKKKYALLLALGVFASCAAPKTDAIVGPEFCEVTYKQKQPLRPFFTSESLSEPGTYYSVTISPNGQLIAVATSANVTHLFDAS